MALSRMHWADEITTVGTTKLYPIGELREYIDASGGRQVWRYVYNGSGASIARRLLVMQATGSAPAVALDYYEFLLGDANCEKSRLLGVTQHAIADASYGWVLADGVGEFTSDGTTTADAAQMGAANGQLTDWAAGAETDKLVWALETESPAGAGGFFTGRISAL